MIPDFLKPKNRKEPDGLDLQFHDAIRRYLEHFKDSALITEPSTFTAQEWIDMLNECIEENITIWELWGEEYNPSEYY